MYRYYKNQIETTLSGYIRKKTYTESDLRQVELTIQKMCDVPEHEIYKNVYTLAKYYHVLNMLYTSIKRLDLAFLMLQKACEIADSDTAPEELYGEIYSDMCAYVKTASEKLKYAQKSLKIFEHLQKEGKKYSRNSHAMTLFNTSVILVQEENYKLAIKYAENANAIWKDQILSETDEQIKAYLAESERLIAFLKKKLM